MGLRIYERGVYVCHNHGIVPVLLSMGVGDVRFTYQSVMPEYHLSSLKKEVYADMVMRGDLFQDIEDGKYFFKEPLMAFVKLTNDEVLKIKKDNIDNENVKKIIEYCESHPMEDYVFDIELRVAF